MNLSKFLICHFVLFSALATGCASHKTRTYTLTNPEKPSAASLKIKVPAATSTQAAPLPTQPEAAIDTTKNVQSSVIPTAQKVTAPIMPSTSISPTADPSIATAPIVGETKPLIALPDANSKVIGAILPLTGKYASLGQHAQNAIKLGLDLDKPGSEFSLVVYDSESNPDLAAKGVHKLVLEDKAIALLGGFTSKEATSIAQEAERLQTAFIGFSQKSGLTDIGSHVFRNALTPEMQVDRLVQYAVEKLSAKKFAILYPNDSYGVEFSNIFWDHVLARGGEITGAQMYDPKDNDFSEPVQKLLGTYYVEARLEEYKAKVAALKAAEQKSGATTTPNKKGSRSSWYEENILDPIVDFDVLFVPDNSRALGQIMAFMKYNNVNQATYLGTNLWNSPELPKRALDEKAKVFFVDAFDVSTTAEDPNPFFKTYLDLYGEEASLIEVQAFESAQIIKNQINSGNTSRKELVDSLRSMGRSDGVTGQLRMSTQREIERPIHVLTLNSGLVKKTE